jgi:hypothetical protein
MKGEDVGAGFLLAQDLATRLINSSEELAGWRLNCAYRRRGIKRGVVERSSTNEQMRRD